VPDIESLGLSPPALARLLRLLAADHGLIVVAGPRGSGRSTTLGSIAATLGAAIQTGVVAEMPGSSLAPVPPQAAAAVLLGDIDDERIAADVVNADRRGPLFLGAIEADDLAAAACRLGGLGVPAAAIASSLVGIITQRLVRRLCESCRQPFEPNAGVLEALNLSPGDALEFYGTVGCDACDYSGFRGRVALFEVLEIDGELRRLIAQSAPEAEIRAAVRAGGMATLADEGLASVKAGITTANELLRHVQMTNAPRPLCLGCGVALENDYVACPRCATRRYAPCGRCGRALQPGWRVCPYCERVVPAVG
jgi:type II secretory ATPase GspE/PulE/Tfp pilus assembly ATPase PilB-like protein